jgi:ribosomal protein S18 acetylase RimI-like enzyme
VKGITIRPGRIEDAERVRSFTEDTFAWGDYVGREFPTWLDRPDELAIVAADDEGSAVAVARVGLLSEAEAWLSGARVHPDHRRQGIGSVMNDFGVEWSRERGAKVIRLATEETNTAARAQVEKLGYRAIARFALAVRAIESRTTPGSGPGSNGGRRLTGTERLDLAPSAEADPAYLVWSTGDQARVAHQLFPADGWAFRRLRPADLVAAAKARRLWTSPSAWVVTEEEDDEMWVPLFITTIEDADRAAVALVDLAQERAAGLLRVMIPRVDWLEEALQRHQFQLAHPNLIYEKAL